MRIDAFAHALPPRYRARVTGLLEARGDETAQQYAWMLGNDPTLTELEARFALMDAIGAGAVVRSGSRSMSSKSASYPEHEPRRITKHARQAEAPGT